MEMLVDFEAMVISDIRAAIKNGAPSERNGSNPAQEGEEQEILRKFTTKPRNTEDKTLHVS